jgi:hypothetical protein
MLACIRRQPTAAAHVCALQAKLTNVIIRARDLLGEPCTSSPACRPIGDSGKVGCSALSGSSQRSGSFRRLSIKGDKVHPRPAAAEGEKGNRITSLGDLLLRPIGTFGVTRLWGNSEDPSPIEPCVRE